MILYEWEGKKLLERYGVPVPHGVKIFRGDDITAAYVELCVRDVVVKAQILSGKRGKNNGILFCSGIEEVSGAVNRLFGSLVCGQYVASVLLEERLEIAHEQYLSITYDTGSRRPVLMSSMCGGIDIEDVSPADIVKQTLDVRAGEVPALSLIPYARNMWDCFLREDARLLEINPLIITSDGHTIAGDAKIALDDDAIFRHSQWSNYEARTMLGRLPTERERAARAIDEGEQYYRGTAGKYIELDGDIAVLFSGGGASIANMDALERAGLKAANYSEYSGNPPREKVHRLAQVVLSKPDLRGLWIAGGVANFTNVADTFQGIADALDELKPSYPIVVRRAGPFEKEGMELMTQCAKRNNLDMHLFGKETPMGDTASVLADMIHARSMS
ncbi:MAG: ATP-grasp domain-containing protein [Patescibacteria group bacterium]